MAKLRRIANKKDEFVSIMAPVTNDEIEERNDKYNELTQKIRF